MDTDQGDTNLLTDEQLAKGRDALVGFGRLRTSVADVEPGSLKDLIRINEGAQAIEALVQLATNQEADGAIYINRQDAYLRLRPNGQLEFSDPISVARLLGWVDEFQVWISAMEQVVVMGVTGDPNTPLNATQEEAVQILKDIEDAAGRVAVHAYKCWIDKWARKQERTIRLRNVNGTQTSLRIPSSSRLHLAAANFGNVTQLTPPLRLVIETVRSVAPILLVRTATGQTFLTHRTAATAAMAPGCEIRYHRPSRTKGDAWFLRSMKLKCDA